VAAIPFAGQPTCLSGNSVGKKFVNFSHRANLSKEPHHSLLVTFPALAQFFLNLYLNPKARRARIIIKKNCAMRSVTNWLYFHNNSIIAR